MAEIAPPASPPAAKPIDAAEIVRQTLKNVYAFRLWPRDQFKLETVQGANISGPSGPPPGRRAVDLTAMAECSFRAGTSSGASETKK